MILWMMLVSNRINNNNNNAMSVPVNESVATILMPTTRVDRFCVRESHGVPTQELHAH